MDPLSAGLGIAGLGLKLLGGILGSSAADDAHAAQVGIFNQEIEANKQKYNAMVLASRRQQLDILRNSQRARALALSSATNQGAQYGTGIQGGLNQIEGQTNTNLLGNAQGLEIGRNMSTISDNISRFNMQLSDAQTSMSNAQGIMSLGGSLMTAGPTIGNIMKGFGGGLNLNSIFGGGSPSGYGR